MTSALLGVTLTIVSTVMIAGCGHLSGSAVADPSKAEGLRYYMARPQFVVTQVRTGDKLDVTVAVRKNPDLRYPQEVYLQQGWFSADIFGVQLTEHGLLASVSGDATDKSVESVKSVANFAVSLAST